MSLVVAIPNAQSAEKSFFFSAEDSISKKPRILGTNTALDSLFSNAFCYNFPYCLLVLSQYRSEPET
jgi:hypothetical protein